MYMCEDKKSCDTYVEAMYSICNVTELPVHARFRASCFSMSTEAYD